MTYVGLQLGVIFPRPTDNKNQKVLILSRLCDQFNDVVGQLLTIIGDDVFTTHFAGRNKADVLSVGALTVSPRHSACYPIVVGCYVILAKGDVQQAVFMIR